MRIQTLKEIGRNHLNQQVELWGMLIETKVRIAKNEKRYADLILQDNTKRVEVRYWDYEENLKFFEEMQDNALVAMTAVVGEYQGQLQLTAKAIRLLGETEANPGDFLPVSEWGMETLMKGLDYFYDKVETPHLKKLLDKMIFHQDFFQQFSTYPAGKQVHHNFYHGLLQHVLEVLKYAYTVATTKKLSQRQVERLIVMVLLHDWAKIIEYTPLPSIGFTEEGAMLGHIFLGAHHAYNAMREIEDFDREDMLIILNGILSHHGKLEYGSPVLPKTVEAQILHHADKMSGDIESILAFTALEDTEGATFTGKLWNMGTEYYLKGRD